MTISDIQVLLSLSNGQACRSWKECLRNEGYYPLPGRIAQI
jgi:hypothetical protein